VALSHDVALRNSMQEWIQAWRNYAALHPEYKNDLHWREQKYSQIIAMLDARISLVDSFTCSKCGITSHNPNDIRERYCGRCHEFQAL